LSSTRLSLDISHLLTRARSGEAIDADAEGAALAARYRELGLSAELIGKAIGRAAGMLGVSLDGAPQGRAAPNGGATIEPANSHQPAGSNTPRFARPVAELRRAFFRP
jgi:hypothetical protein